MITSNYTVYMFISARCKFFSLTETPEDYTLMLDEEGFTGTVTLLLPVLIVLDCGL